MSTMMRSFVSVVACLVMVGGGRFARGQDGPPFPKPTAEHQLLAQIVGTWDATVKSWIGGPDSEPLVSQGVEAVKLVPSGLWLLTEFDGKFADMEFHGCGQTGYDTKKKKYVCAWIDLFSTEIVMTEGDYDPESRTLTTYSKGTDPAAKPLENRVTPKRENDDTRVFTMFTKSEESKDEYVKMMEITYKRRAK